MAVLFFSQEHEALHIADMKSEDINIVDIVVIPDISKLNNFLFNVIPRYPLNVFVKGKEKFPGILEFMKPFVMSFYILSKTYLRIGVSHYQDICKLRIIFPTAQFQRVEHHVAHAASVFFTSGFNKGLIVSTDYWGDYVSTMVCLGEGKDIKLISRSYFLHSLGYYCASLKNGWDLRQTGTSVKYSDWRLMVIQIHLPIHL